MIHERTSASSVAVSGCSAHATATPRAVAARYRHILAPTLLDPADRAALLQAMELAALHGAPLTVLYVSPDEGPVNSLHWLDAIDRLHRALNGGGGRTRSDDAAAASDLIRSNIKHFLERELPASLVASVEIRIDWRCGDFGDVIVQFADATTADLIVLSSGPARRWLPALPAEVRRVLQRSNREVLIVRPDARPTHA